MPLRHAAWLLLLPVALTIHGLLTGADWLTRPTVFWPALPLGNLATWGSLLCLALISFRWRPRGWLRTLARLNVALALTWGPLGYVLSGNWSWSFQQSDFLAGWIGLTAGMTLLLLFSLTAAALSHRRRSAQD